MFAVMRRPILMEDEGRYEFNGSFRTKEEAEEHVRQLVQLSKGYFHKSDYSIMSNI